MAFSSSIYVNLRCDHLLYTLLILRFNLSLYKIIEAMSTDFLKRDEDTEGARADREEACRAANPNFRMSVLRDAE
jgi:hypothetical protein